MGNGDEELYECVVGGLSLSDQSLEQAFSEFCQVKIINDCNTSKSSGIEFLTINKQNIPDLNNFRIEFNGVILDSEIPVHQRIKYHELCCDQNRFLHANIIVDSIEFVCLMIRRTAAIAAVLQAAYSEGDFSDGDFERNDEILESFQNMGMTVGFLRQQIKELHLQAQMRDLEMSSG